jgi:hypothetical protein
LLNTRQIRRSESQKFAQYSPNPPERVTKIWRIFGEYSNSTNSPASGHCLSWIQSNKKAKKYQTKRLTFDLKRKLANKTYIIEITFSAFLSFLLPECTFSITIMKLIKFVKFFHFFPLIVSIFYECFSLKTYEIITPEDQLRHG